jgi:hypothetical protein
MLEQTLTYSKSHYYGGCGVVVVAMVMVMVMVMLESNTDSYLPASRVY